MTADIQGAIADWLHRRGLRDEDGFAKRAAIDIAALERRDSESIRVALAHIKTDLFRRNASTRKSDVCHDLAMSLETRCTSLGGDSMQAPTQCKIVFFA